MSITDRLNIWKKVDFLSLKVFDYICEILIILRIWMSDMWK